VSEVRGEERLEDERADEEPPLRLGIGALARDTAIYGGTRVLVRSLAFLLIPLYAHFLTPREFGVLELVLAITALVDVFINLPGTLARFYFDRNEPQWRRQVVTVYFTIEAVYPAVLIGALIAFSGPIASGAVGAATYAALVVISLCDLYLTNIVDMPLNLCRLRRKPFRFAAYALTRSLIHVVFSALFVAVWELGVKGILIASLISGCVTFLATAREYIRDLTRSVSFALVKEMLSFSWPTLITGFSFYLLNFIDRFFIRHYHGLDENGLYGVAYRYSNIVFVAVVAFRLGWPQWHYSWLNTDRHPTMVARGANYYFFFLGFLASVVSLWILPLFRVLMPPEYWEATVAVPPLALAAVAGGAYTVVVVSFQVTKRMRMLLPVTAVGAAIGVALYFLLVPPFSFEGAAWGTAAAMAALTAIAGVVGRRIYAIPWDLRRLVTVLAVTIAVAVAAVFLDARAPYAASLAARGALTLAYPAVLVALGFFTARDLERARQIARRLVPGRAS
jgi:O-antigen/teichoic acid export membrane protein